MTGVLPITLGESTKIVQALLYAGKEYVCVMKIHADASEADLKQVLSLFEDAIYQRPPLRASVKRQLRTRRIYYIDYVEKDGRNVLFKVGCEGGTYIRKLCFDIGEILGIGAHMQELRRTRAGPYVEDQSVTLHEVSYRFDQWKEQKNDEILKRFVSPMEDALVLLPKVFVRDSAVDAICHGASLTVPGVVSSESGIVKDVVIAILTLKGEAVALGMAKMSSEEIGQSEHGIVATVQRVLMTRGTYPKCWRTSERIG